MYSANKIFSVITKKLIIMIITYTITIESNDIIIERPLKLLSASQLTFTGYDCLANVIIRLSSFHIEQNLIL